MAELLAGELINQMTKIPFVATNIGGGYPSELAQQKNDADLITKSYIQFLLSQVNDGNENAADALIMQQVVNAQGTTEEIKANYESINNLTQGNIPGVVAPTAPPDFTKGPATSDSWWGATDKKATPGTVAGTEAGVLGDSPPPPADPLGGVTGSTASPSVFKDIGGGEEGWPMNLIGNCIPCGLKIKDLLEFNPFPDILQMLMDYLNAMYQKLLDFLKLFQITDISQDVCMLLSFFNFMCIPDLAALLAMLNFLIMDIVNAIKSMTLEGGILMLWGLLAPLFTPFFIGLEAMLEQWIKTILAPIDCIIDSILLQLEKLENFAEELQFSFQYQKMEIPIKTNNNMVPGQKMEFYYPDPTPSGPLFEAGQGMEDAMEKMSDALSGLKDSIHAPLVEVINIALQGRDKLLDKWYEVRDMLISMMGLDLDYADIIAEMTAMVKRIMRLVSIVAFIITVMQMGLYCDPQQDWDPDKMKDAVAKGLTKKPGLPFADDPLPSDLVDYGDLYIPDPAGEDGLLVVPWDVIPPTSLTPDEPAIDQYQELAKDKEGPLWKAGTFITLDECLNTAAKNFGKISKLMEDIQSQKAQVGM